MENDRASADGRSVSGESHDNRAFASQNTAGTFQFPEEAKTSIIRDLIQPAMIRELKDYMEHRKYWAKAANISDLVGKICIVLATILAFFAFYSQDDPKRECAFISGVFGIISLTLMYFEARAKNSERECYVQINGMFKNMGIIQPHTNNETAELENP